MLVGLGSDPGTQPMAGMIREREAEGGVSLPGVRAELPHTYPAFGLACLSSAFGEGTPDFLIEARACGMPCVATNVAESRQVVSTYRPIVRPNGSVALQAAWDDVPSLDFAAAARGRGVTVFAETTVCYAYDTLYRSLRWHEPKVTAASRFPLNRT